MGSRVGTAGDNQSPNVIISNYRHDRRADKNPNLHDGNMRYSLSLIMLFCIFIVSYFLILMFYSFRVEPYYFNETISRIKVLGTKI